MAETEPKISLLICHKQDRLKLLNRLMATLSTQDLNGVELLVDGNDGTVGEKRNRLLQKAKGKYIAFIDDDDFVSDDYIYHLMQGVDSDVDCCSLVGEISFDGKNPKKFIHSIKYNSYFEKNNVYFRPPNHLNMIRSSIAKQFKFPEKNHGEDTAFAMQICYANVLRTEHEINSTIYYYDFKSNK